MRRVCGSDFYSNFVILTVLKLFDHSFHFFTISIFSHRFAINLTLGHLHRDIALHINPRLPQNYIVRNTKINGKWGKEEVTSSLPFTLNRGQRFAIQILVTDDYYLISVNGLHFTTYAHRIPYQKVSCIQVAGDICDVNLEQLPIRVGFIFSFGFSMAKYDNLG